MSISWEAFGRTDVGRVRAGNEDDFRADPARGIFLVADGMGGHVAGEVASDLAARTTLDVLTRDLPGGGPEGDAPLGVLREAVLAAHDAIVRCCQDDRSMEGMGTTLTACVVGRGGAFYAAHIGDSRLYRMRNGSLEQLTTDHTWVQREVDEGRLSPEAGRTHRLSHILTRVLSDGISGEPDLLGGTLLPGDHLLLASDGLYNMVPDEEIARALSSDRSVPDIVDGLIERANLAGGTDNVTVIVVRILPG